jgi:glycosyltransferase involved in cell wall biosynthesis
MNILFVNPFAQQVSGPDESLISLIGGLSKDINPYVIVPPNSPQLNRYESVGATVFELPMQRIQRFENLRFVTKYSKQFLPDIIQFIKIIRSYKFDLIHTNMEVVLQSGLAARVMGIPSVYHVRSTSIAHPRRVCDLLVAGINRCSDEIIVVSKAVGQIFFQRGINDKVSIIYNSIDTDQFGKVSKEKVCTLRNELTQGSGGPLVATVGRINPRKGLECFIKAIALVETHCSNTRFAIVGDASDPLEQNYLKGLKDLANTLGVASKLVFVPAKQNIAELMSAIDIFVMSSINEGFGRVAIEAMAANRPVIASNIGGLPEIVEDGKTGILVNPNDPQAFSTAILRLLANKELSIIMGDKGRVKVEEQFSRKAMIPAVMEVYQRVLSK